MLVEFRIRNFALVDDVTIGVGPGLNILTGETGSGKSVIVTALSVLLGAQPSGPLVRAGCDSARLDAFFHTEDPEIARLLRESGIEPEEDGGLTLSREFSAAKRSTARINNAAAPLSLLRNVAERLVDLHGQYAHQSLLRSHDHAQFLDATGKAPHKKLVKETAENFQQLRQARARLGELRNSSEQLAKEAELLRYRVDEIDSLISCPEDAEAISREIKIMEHARELSEALEAAYESASRAGADNSALNKLAGAQHALSRVRGIDAKLDEAADMFDEADALLDTACRSLASLRERFQHDSVKLEELRESDFRIKDLLKKTGSATAVQLFDYKRKSEERLAIISVDEAGLEKLEREERELESQAAKTAELLSESRAKLAGDFSKRIQKELKELAMAGAVFDVAFEPFDSGELVKLNPGGRAAQLRETGLERVEFLISSNPGEPPRPLAQIASGGELSRIMLAFKSLLRDADPVPVLVFDEIDAGIGGETAHSIARKLASLSGERQIISITHLPQIAAAADRHITAAKVRAGGRTVIRTAEVSGVERLREMTRMLGATGQHESESLAKKLMQDAEKYKKK